jgi:biotin transport system substrate-specific component
MQQRTAAAIPRPTLAVSTVAVIGASLATALCAWVSIGWPVPITLQTFGVLGTAAWLGSKRGAAAQLLYLAEGAVGIPVFAHEGSGWFGVGTGGMHILTSKPSAGYLFGYPLAAFLTGLVCERFGRGFYITVPAMLLGSVALYATGLIWLHHELRTTWSLTVHLGLTPFVLGDLCKIIAAAAIVDPQAPWGRWIGRRQL